MQMWDYRGSNTLKSYLDLNDGLQTLAVDMGIAQKDVVPTVMYDILKALAVRLGAEYLPPSQQSHCYSTSPYSC